MGGLRCPSVLSANARVLRGAVCVVGSTTLVVYAYQPEILEALARHGLIPAAHTHPSLVRHALSDLYRYEIRRLRQDLLKGRVAKGDYIGCVIALRRKYWLLSLPTELWTSNKD